MEASKLNAASKALLRKVETFYSPSSGTPNACICRWKIGCFMKFYYFFGCMLATASLAVCPEIGLAHGGEVVGEAAVTI
jgi:hypothetical protein